MSPHQYISELVPLADYMQQELGYDIHRLPQQVSCPLHTDRKPSMRLYYPKDRGGYCFSCGKSYTSFQLHQKLYNLSYPETIEQMTKIFNIDLSKIQDNTPQVKSSDNQISKKVTALVNQVKGHPKGLLTNFDKLSEKVYKLLYKD